MIHADKIVMATGSAPFEIPTLPFSGNVISSTEILALTKVPKRLIVVGGGYIGLEISTAIAKLGAGVTVVEFASRILPQYDSELTKPVADRLTAPGLTVLLTVKAEGLSFGKVKLRVTLDNGEHTELPFDKALVTVGRKTRTEDCGLDELELKMNGQFIQISGPHVWDKQCIPAVCVTDPEIVAVGFWPERARGLGDDIVTQGFTPEEGMAQNVRSISIPNRGTVSIDRMPNRQA